PTQDTRPSWMMSAASLTGAPPVPSIRVKLVSTTTSAASPPPPPPHAAARRQAPATAPARLSCAPSFSRRDARPARIDRPAARQAAGPAHGFPAFQIDDRIANPPCYPVWLLLIGSCSHVAYIHNRPSGRCQGPNRQKDGRSRLRYHLDLSSYFLARFDPDACLRP